MGCKACGEESKTYYCRVCETLVVFRGFTRKELREAFDRVAPETNWKNPVDACLPYALDAREEAAVKAAVTFYTGSTAEVRYYRRYTYVKAAGYYLAVGA